LILVGALKAIAPNSISFNSLSTLLGGAGCGEGDMLSGITPRNKNEDANANKATSTETPIPIFHLSFMITSYS
jgi:hypothetical protein